MSVPIVTNEEIVMKTYIAAVKRMSCDSPPKPYWRVVEVVAIDPRTGRDLTIEWPGCYSSESAANSAIAKVEG